MLDPQNSFFKSGLAVLAVLLFLALFQIIFPKTFSFFSNKVYIITEPFYDLGKIILSKNLASEELIAENLVLQDAWRRVVVDYAKLEVLEKENVELKKLYNFYEANDYQFQTAKIIGLQKLDNNQLIILNQGRGAGLMKGQAVVVADGILLGLVARVENDVSYVSTLNQNLVSISAKVVGRGEGIHGVVEGIAGISISLNLIPKDVEIELNDLVVTSGLDPFIPAGLVIGLVERIADSSNSFFKSANLSSLAEPEDFTYAGVIVNSFFLSEGLE